MISVHLSRITEEITLRFDETHRLLYHSRDDTSGKVDLTSNWSIPCRSHRPTPDAFPNRVLAEEHAQTYVPSLWCKSSPLSQQTNYGSWNWRTFSQCLVAQIPVSKLSGWNATISVKQNAHNSDRHQSAYRIIWRDFQAPIIETDTKPVS